MVDIFKKEGIKYEPEQDAEPQSKSGAKDIFAAEGISVPSITERNTDALSAGINIDAPEGEDQQFVAKAIKEDVNGMEQIAKTRFTPEQIEGFKNNPIGFLDSFKYLRKQDVIPLGGVKTAYDLFDVNSIAKKMEKGEPLSEGETEKINGFIDREVEMSLRGFSIGGGIAYGASQLPAFMIEFLASGGVGKIGQTAAVKTAEKVVSKAVVTKAIGVTANVVARTAVMPSLYAPRYAERRLNNFAAVTDKGEMILAHGDESPAKSALLAFGYSSAEVASEMSGAAIGKYVLDPVKGILKTPLIAGVNRLPAGVREAIYTAYKKVNPNAQVSKVFTAAGWNGMVEELGEERVNDIMKATLGLAGNDKQAAKSGDYSFDDYLKNITPSSDQLLVEAGIVSIAGGAKTSADITFNLLKNKGVAPAKASQMVDNMSANEQEQFVKENLVEPVSGFVPTVTPEVQEKPVPVQNEKMQDIAVGTPAAEVSEQEAIADGAHPSPVLLEGEVSQAQINAVEQADPPKIIDEESTANKFIREWINELDPIQKLPEMARQRGMSVSEINDTKLLSATYSGILGQIRQNLQVNTFAKDANGNNVITGKALKSTLDDFDNMFMATEGRRSAREQDFSDYLVAQRYMEDLDPREDVEVTEEQKAKSVSDLARLGQKYGDNFRFFEVFAQEVYDFQRRILKNLVDSGVMSQESYDEIISKNKNYVPFQRVLDEETFAGVVSQSAVFSNANANRIIKRISGSDKEVKNVFHSIIKNTARIVDMSARNQVAQSIANLESVLPEYIQRVETPMVKKGTAKVKVTYDKRLREKLEQTIKLFGEEFQQKKTLNKKGQRGYIRGDYSPSEKLVRLRLGSSDAVLTHEVGHMLDFRLGLKNKLLSDPEIKKQLVKLAEQRLSAQTETIQKGQSINFEETATFSESQKHIDYVKSDREILANMFDAYVNAPDLLKKIAPKAKKAFEDIIDSTEELKFIKQIKPSLERSEEEVEQDVWGAADYAPPNTITVRRNGVKEYYRVAKPILQAMESMNPAKLNVIEKIFTASASLLRSGATLVPEFWVRNVLRDQQTALLQSGVKYRPTDFVKGLFAVVSKNDLYNEWERSGGSFNSYMELNDDGLEKAYEELFRPQGRLMRYLKNPINLAADISGALEQATRIGVFSRAQEEGQSDIQSALTSRDATLDFSRHGSEGKRINRWVPFFNAGLQGTNKLIRTFKSNPAAATFWGVATITLPSILITGYYLYGAPDDERKEYLEIPEWQRDMFWIVKVGGEWKRYPKPFTYGYIFGSMPERMMMWMYQGNKPEGQAAWKDIVMGLGGAFSPVYDASSLIPPIAKVAIEDVANYNFFTGRNIYPEWMEKLDPEMQSSKYTSETAKFLGEKLGVSPAKIENTLRGQLAGASDYVTGAGDLILDKVKEWNGEKNVDKPITPSDIAVLKAFAVRRPAGYRSQSAKFFFENYDEVQKKHNSLKKLEGSEKKEYEEKNRKVLSQYSFLSSTFKEMKGLQKQVDAIYDNRSMSSEDKVKRINDLEDRITEIARRANTSYNKSVGE